MRIIRTHHPWNFILFESDNGIKTESGRKSSGSFFESYSTRSSAGIKSAAILSLKDCPVGYVDKEIKLKYN